MATTPMKMWIIASNNYTIDQVIIGVFQSNNSVTLIFMTSKEWQNKTKEWSSCNGCPISMYMSSSSIAGVGGHKD